MTATIDSMLNRSLADDGPAAAALIKPDNKILGLSPAHGGYSTRGLRIDFSGPHSDVAECEVSEKDHRVDMAHLARPVAAGLAKAFAFKKAAGPDFAEPRQQSVRDAKFLAGRLRAEAGILALTGSTDVQLVDPRNSELDGKQAEDRLPGVGTTVTRDAPAGRFPLYQNENR